MAEIIKKQKAMVEETSNVTLYPIEDLIDNSFALTGYKKEVAVGALFNCNKKEMSRDEFKGLVEQFLKRSVK